MIVAHVAPFAPNRCGLYEAARDMARADISGGNDVLFVDSGITKNGKREAGQIGAVDNRGDFLLKTCDPKLLDSANIIIMHTGVSDSWLVRNQAPLIWAVHGRPLACFRPERMGKGNSYSLYQNVANWQRTKGMLYFWKEFKPHWEPIFQGKDIILPYPVIDEIRFKTTYEKHNLKNPGEINILVCDSEREDIDHYNMVVGLLEAVKKHPGLKVHFFGLDMINGDLPNCWNILLGEIKKQGGLGDVSGRIGNMEKVYNAVDCLISPNKIITRTIGEALSCGIPVISENNTLNLMSDYTCDMSDPADILEAVSLFIQDKKNNTINSDNIKERSKVFNLDVYSDYMNGVYNNILNG
jgi:glycosyltransferase involved in cell wall biosynthesis